MAINSAIDLSHASLHYFTQYVAPPGLLAICFPPSSGLRRWLIYVVAPRLGRAERTLLAEVRNYVKPLFTPDGKRVIYSDRYGKDIFVVNWDGTGQRRLGAGFAVEVWADPTGGDTWVYAATQVGKINSINFKSVKRTKLDGKTRWEPVWDKTEISPDNFQLSADGRHAGGEFPWPHG